MLIVNNITAFRHHITEWEKQYGRESHSVQLLAVSKGQSIDKIMAAYNVGQRAFGENYLQEALPKINQLPDDIEWHFIGSIQRNKTRDIAQHFAWVQTVHDIHTAKRLSDQRLACLPSLNICIQVNISHEASKSGVDPNALLPLVESCLTLPRLKLRGLMAIPANDESIMQQRQSFHQLFVLWQSLRERGIALDTLSMGMSHDVEAAIAEGATLVRVGTAIFGSRS